eukprot:613216-Rhodomonas_salina.1
MQRTMGILANVPRMTPLLRSHVRTSLQLRSFASAGSNGNVWSVLQESVKANNVGEDTAVVSVRQEDSLSHRKLLEVSSCFAGGLTNNLGYSPGDKLALALGNNSLEHVVAHVGAAMAGVTLVTAKDPSEPHLAGSPPALYRSTCPPALHSNASSCLSPLPFIQNAVAESDNSCAAASQAAEG